MVKKSVLVLLSVLVVLSFLTACSKAEEPVLYDSLSELSDAVEFDVINPQGMPDGYALAGYYSVGRNLAQIVYVNGNEELIFAMTPLKEIECAMEGFDKTGTKDIGGVEFEYSYAGEAVLLAVARTNAFTYAIYSKNGLSEEQMTQAAQGLGL